MKQAIWVFVAILATIALDFLIQRWLATRRKRNSEPPRANSVRVFGHESPFLTWLHPLYLRIKSNPVFTRNLILPLPTLRSPALPRFSWLSTFEFVIIIAWAMYLGRGYLNFNPVFVPSGGDYEVAVSAHQIWTNLLDCGTCILWNGTINGGAPAFVDLHGSMLHPLVILSTLLLGVINGSKVYLVGGLCIAGIAQRQLGKAIDLPFFPRLWTALIAVAGGHLSGKMEFGLSTMLLSIATASLILAPAVELLWKGNRKALPWLALAFALTWLSGQGYIQIAVAGAWLPAMLFLSGRDRQKWKDLFFALGLSLLLSAVFILPLLHFYPWMEKPTEETLKNLQSGLYSPLNLVINDMRFFQQETLTHEATPSSYINFIGWVPVLLSFLGTWATPRKDLRLTVGLLLMAILPFVVTSVEFMRFVQQFTHWVDGLRFFSMGAALAVPPLLALAGKGMQVLFGLGRRWLASAGLHGYTYNPLLLVALPLAVISLSQTYRFAHQFYALIPARHVAEDLRSAGSQWIQPPIGDFQMTVVMIDQGYKLSYGHRAWWWKEHGNPLPRRELQWNDAGLVLYEYPANEYAVMETPTGRVACQAHAVGGKIDVVCPPANGGWLVVQENNWTGWFASVDGKAVPLKEGTLLAVDLPPGATRVAFRYRPWDVWAGLALSLAGWAIWVAVWLGKPQERRVEQTNPGF